MLRVVQVGNGAFGWSWLQEILVVSEQIEVVGIVERNQDYLLRAAKIGGVAQEALFTDLIEAIEKRKPDFVLNTTPPHIHCEIIRTCLRYGIPVLCEKPISDDLGDVLTLYQEVQNSGVQVMIAENYRYNPIMRKTKQLLAEGRIGQLTSIDVAFMQRHRMHNYHANLKHPLLVDVSIHHIDMLRYFTGQEGSLVFAQTWSPASSWYPQHSNAHILMEMEDGLRFSYRGSLDAAGHLTDWSGTWKFQGELGVICVKRNQIIVELLDRKEAEVISFAKTEDSRSLVLQEFIASLREGRPAETGLSDNMKTFCLTYAAIQSAEQGKAIHLRNGLLA